MKICKNSDFRQISGISAGKKISQKSDSAIFWALFIRIFVQKNQKKLMMKSRENAKKPVFPAYFQHFLPENTFFKNRAPSHFGHCHFASLCQKSEKTNEPISRKAGNRRTDGRTDKG